MNKAIDISAVELTTERLKLRPWRESDLDDFYAYASVDGVGQMAGWKPHSSKEESAEILSMFIEEKKTFALEYEGKVIGSVGIEEYNETFYPELDALYGREIGYALSKDYWGQGFMPEAVQAVLSYLFREVRLDFVLVGHFDWNTQSRRVIQKCGFHYSKTTDFETQLGTTEKSVNYILYREEALRKKLTHKGTQTIETERLVLRRATVADAPAMFKNWASDPEVSKFLTWPPHSSAELTEKIISGWVESYEDESYYTWMIELRELGEPIGSISVVSHDDSMAKAEIGYCIGTAWWHQGIMTEAVKAVIAYLFDEVGMNRLEAKHDPNNPHSGDVMRKCGMTYEGILRKAGKSNQGIHDNACYAILREGKRTV